MTGYYKKATINLDEVDPPSDFDPAKLDKTRLRQASRPGKDIPMNPNERSVADRLGDITASLEKAVADGDLGAIANGVAALRRLRMALDTSEICPGCGRPWDHCDCSHCVSCDATGPCCGECECCADCCECQHPEPNGKP
jgi:hypothetical protein